MGNLDDVGPMMTDDEKGLFGFFLGGWINFRWMEVRGLSENFVVSSRSLTVGGGDCVVDFWRRGIAALDSGATDDREVLFWFFRGSRFVFGWCVDFRVRLEDSVCFARFPMMRGKDFVGGS